MKLIGIFFSLLLFVIILWVIIEFVLISRKNSWYQYTNSKLFSSVTFPEKKFPIPVEYQSNFKDKVIIGKELAASSRIVFTGCVQNCEDNLIIQLKRLKWLAESFEDYIIVLFENGSTDKTKNILEKAQIEDPHIILLDCPPDENCHGSSSTLKGVEKIKYMSKLRNIYLEYVRTNYADWEWLMVMDFNINGPISRLGMLHSLSFLSTDKNAGIIANCVQHLPFTFGQLTILNDRSSFKFNEQEKILSSSEFYKNRFNNQEIVSDRVKRGGKTHEVSSSFTGIGLYRIRDILDNKYDFSGNNISEHVFLNTNIAKNYSNPFIINPAFYCLVN